MEMTSTDVKDSLLIKHDMQKLGIDREILFAALDGIVSEIEFYNFLDGKGCISAEVKHAIARVLERTQTLRVTRNDSRLVVSLTGRIIQKSRPESEFLLGKRCLQSA